MWLDSFCRPQVLLTRKYIHGSFSDIVQRSGFVPYHWPYEGIQSPVLRCAPAAGSTALALRRYPGFMFRFMS